MSRNHERIKNDPRWKAARTECLDRDDHQCVECGEDEQLQADHIISLEDAPELAFEVENLQTLCQGCHTDKTNAKAGMTRNNWHHPDYPELSTLFL